MRFVRYSLIALFGATLLQQSLHAEVPVPVKAFPEGTSVVVRFADPVKTVKKVSDLASGVDPVASGTIGVMGAGVGTLVDNPSKQGIKPGTDWWVGVIAQKDGPPIMIYAVQGSDQAVLKEAVGPDYQFVTHDNWTVYTKDAETAKSIAACVEGTGASIESKATEETKTLFMDADIAVFVNLAQLNVTFKDEINVAREEVTRELEMAELNLPPVDGINMSAVLDLYKQMFMSIVAAVEDSNSFTLAFNIDPQGFKERFYLEVKSGTATDKFLQVHKPGTLENLAKLPAGQLGYMGMHGDVSSMMSWSLNLMTSMFELDEEQQKGFAAIGEEAKKFDYGSYLMSFGLGDKETGYLKAAVVNEVKNAPSMREFNTKVLTLMNNVGEGEALPAFGSIELKPNAEKVGDLSVDHVIVTQEINEELDPLGIQKQIMNVMYGPEGAVSRVVYTPNAIVQSTGGGIEFLEEILKSWNSPSPSSAMTSTRENLGKEANVLVMFDLPGFLVEVLAAVTENVGPGMIPLDASEIENLRNEPSYSGYSMSTGAGAVRMQGYMPVEQMRGIYQVVMFGFQTFQNLQNPQF